MELMNLEVSYKQAEIKINDEEKLIEQAKEYAKKFDGYVVTPETEKDDKKVKANLNKFLKAINEKRIETSREYTKPLDDFKAKLLNIVEPVQNAHDNIHQQLKEYADHVKTTRLDTINSEIVRLIDTGLVKKEDIELDSKWTNESFWNNTYNPKKTLIAAIKEVVDNKVKEVKDLEEAKRAIRDLAESSNIGSSPYERMIEDGETLSVVVATLNKDVIKAKERQEEIQRQEEERQRRLAEQQKAFETQKLEESFNANAEIELKVPEVQEDEQESSKYPAELVFKITVENVEKKGIIKEFLDSYFPDEYEINSFKTIGETKND